MYNRFSLNITNDQLLVYIITMFLFNVEDVKDHCSMQNLGFFEKNANYVYFT